MSIGGNNGITTINGSGENVDFRISSSSTTNMFYVDAENGKIGIGTNVPDDLLHLNIADGAYQKFSRTSGTTTGVLGNLRFGNLDIDSNLANITATQDGATNSARIGFFTQPAGGATLERLRIRGTGEITKPYQPAFQARKNAIQTNIAINTDVTVTWQTEVFDQGANFASNTFTAPVTGKYQLNVHLLLDNVDSAASYYQMQLKTSNSLYYDTIDPVIGGADYSYQTLNHSVLADMDAGDTAYIIVYQGGGTSQSDLNATTCVFSGYLVA